MVLDFCFQMRRFYSPQDRGASKEFNGSAELRSSEGHKLVSFQSNCGTENPPKDMCDLQIKWEK